MCVMLILEVILRLAELERWLLEKPGRWAVIAVILAAFAAVTAWRASRSAESDVEMLRFEEVPSWRLTTLDLPR
jgi:hypothetical protein